MKLKSLLVIVICISIATSGLLIVLLIPSDGDGGPTIYRKTLNLDDGAIFTITSFSDVNCSVVSDNSSYPQYFILNIVNLNGTLDGGTANISFYSPTGFGVYDHIAFVTGNNTWSPIPCNASIDGKNLSATIDHLSDWSVIQYPALEILLEAERADNETINLTKNAIDQILLPLGMKNITYYLELQAQGGNGTYNWEFYSGALPTGFNILDNGTLLGNATEFGNFTFELRVSSADYTIEEEFNLTLADYLPNEMLPNASATLLPVAWYAENYVDPGGDNVTIQMGGGNSGPYTIYNISGNLPPGLNLTFLTEGNYIVAYIHGTPGQFGLFNFTMAGYDEIYRNFGTNDPTIGNYIERMYFIDVQ